MNCQRHFAGRFLRVMCAVALALVFVAQSQAESESTSTLDNTKVKDAIDRATEFLKKAQTDDGSFSAKAGPGVTAIVAAGLLKSGRPVQDPVVAKAFKYLESNRHDDGGVYQQGGTHKNYETCLAIIAFQAANGDHHYDKLLADAEKFVKKEQWDEEEGKTEDNVYYGGAGYGHSSRPDLSNTGFLLDALHALGRGDDDPAIQKALIFVSRSQNLKSKYNTEAFADKVNDGGFIYTPVEGGSSVAGKTDDGGLRSYGSMTYAGFKSMIYAGLKKDDPRVKAAHEWIQKHYTLDENPGLGVQGLFYYYHTFAKALDAVGDDKFVDAEGKSHDWRAELAAKYIATQDADGSWVNKTPKWMENDPNLVTAYGLLCLSYCQHKSPPIDHVFSPVAPTKTKR